MNKETVQASNNEMPTEVLDLDAYTFTAEMFVEDDETVTLSLKEIDLVAHGIDEKDARLNLAKDILQYAKVFYAEYELYNNAPNRKHHVPYVRKALNRGDAEKISREIVLVDVFDSEYNMTHLKKVISDIEKGKSVLAEHELIEVD